MMMFENRDRISDSVGLEREIQLNVQSDTPRRADRRLLPIRTRINHSLYYSISDGTERIEFNSPPDYELSCAAYYSLALGYITPR